MTKSHGFALAFFVAAFIVAPIILRYDPVSAFVGSVVALVGITVSVGHTVSSRWLGALINERNVMSLSRFQSLLWTALIVAAFAAISIPRIAKGASLDAIMGPIRPDLLALMGISYASVVMSGLVASNKSTTAPADTATQAAQINTGVPTATNSGLLFKNIDPKQAMFVDIFEGDELADAHLVDMAKLQMFLFTLIGALFFIYSAMNGDIVKGVIPTLPTNLIALMGVSHAAYVGNQTIQKTQTQATQTLQPAAISAPPPPK